jgi:hypothetical protein
VDPAGLIDFSRLTRVTPRTARRRAIRRATARWPLAQPSSWMAGTSSAARSAELVPPAPPWLDTEAPSVLTVTSWGTACARSRKDRSQSKRCVARSRTVAMRAWAADWKSAYGFSRALSAITAALRASSSARSACCCLMVFVVST